MIGSWLRIGSAAVSFCDSLSIRPAMANDWPSRSSTSVSARRVVSAGMRKPSSRMPLLKSSELTSGRTCRRIRSPAIVGLKFRRTPNSLNRIETALVRRPARSGPGTRRRRGSSPPGRCRRSGSARPGSGSSPSACSALMTRADVVLVVEQEQVQEVAEHQPFVVVEVRRRELLRRGAARPSSCSRWTPVKNETPSSVSARRFTSAKRTCSITCCDRRRPAPAAC